MNMQNNVRFEVFESGLACITLSAEKKLNALDTDMLFQIRKHLLDWQQNPNVKVILLSSSKEKAFCAGGDVKSLVLNIQTHGMDAARDFFTTEYSTDYLVYQIKKPMIAMVSGICMGGGLGLIQGCSHRFFNSNCMVAMPEVSIGLFPDVGASHFLNKTKFGKIIGSTAYRLTAAEAKFLSLCDYVGSSDEQNQRLEMIKSQAWSEDNSENYELCSEILNTKHQTISELDDSEFLSLEHEQILSYESGSERVQFAQSSYREGSPLSHKLIQRQFELAESRSLKDCFLMEWQLALNCSEYGDFCEGVQAKLIDKTNEPKWLTNYPLELDNYFVRDEKNLLKDCLEKLSID